MTTESRALRRMSYYFGLLLMGFSIGLIAISFVAASVMNKWHDLQLTPVILMLFIGIGFIYISGGNPQEETPQKEGE